MVLLCSLAPLVTALSSQVSIGGKVILIHLNQFIPASSIHGYFLIVAIVAYVSD